MLKIATVKAFVFDSMANLTPLSPATEAPYEADAFENSLYRPAATGLMAQDMSSRWLNPPGKRLSLQIFIMGGITIKEHLQNANENRADYTFYKNATGKWTYTKNKTLEYGIHNENWDIIVLQQGAADAADITAYEPLGDFIAYVERTKTNENCNFYWHMTWARHDGCPSLNGITSAEEYEKNCSYCTIRGLWGNMETFLQGSSRWERLYRTHALVGWRCTAMISAI